MEPASIIANPTVIELIRETAGEQPSVTATLLNRATEAAQWLDSLAVRAQVRLEDEAYVDVVCQAVRTTDPVKSVVDVYEAAVGWLGPSNVPSKSLSWSERSGGGQHTFVQVKGDAKPEAAPEEAPGKILGEVPASWKEAVAEQPQAEEPLSDAQASQIVAMADEASVADRTLLASYDTIKAAGRIEGLEFMRRVSEVAIAQQFAQVRADKSYKGLPYKAEDGRIKRVETLEEFCEAFFGKSYRRCAQLAETLHLLGPALYEQAQSIGFKARDYRALKALPAEDQEVVKQALESESKEQVLDILQEMAARHQAEREALKKSEADLKADLEAKDAVLKGKTERADKLAVELEKLKRLPPNEAWMLRLEREAEAVQKLDEAHISALAGMKDFLTGAAEIVEAEGITMHTTAHAEGLIIEVFQHLTDYAAEHFHSVRLDVAVSPIWSREAAEAELRGAKK